jgi:lipid II:glycine glycyltransferase (peptidoglycan interpeptide bridge formation enzyme)
MERDLEKENWKYIELRPLLACPGLETHFKKDREFYLHTLDLGASEKDLFRNLHKDSVQRKIHRAEREALTYEEGRSESLLKKFYQLQLLTRRRHALPPQPLDWFRNLINGLGESLKIRVASKDGQPTASILTIRFKDCLVYKYGCSDNRFHNLGGMALLLWRAIQEAKQSGALRFDLGRSDCDNSGLTTFKERWGGIRSLLSYYSYPAGHSQAATRGWKMQVAKQVFTRVPDDVLTLAGKLLYRHIE